MNKIFKFKSYFLYGLSVISVIIILAEVISIWTPPKEYKRVYEFSNDFVEWIFKSIFNYIFSDIIGICFLIFYIILNLILIIKT